jgi:hypothetical protein
VNYDSLHIESQNAILVKEKSVIKIVLSHMITDSYVEIDSLIPDYAENGGEYFLNFRFEETMDKKILNYHFKLKYIFSDQTWIDVDSSTVMLNYPYNSVRIFINADEITDLYIHFQDFYISENILFFHPTGPFGLYKCNLDSRITTELQSYPAGDYIAHDSIYVFWDDSRETIYRYNLESDTTDLQLDLSQLNFSRIAGLDCYQDYLFVLFHSSSGSYLAKFNYEGHFISSVPCTGETFFLSIKDNYFLSHNYGTKLSYYDLSTGNFLHDVLMPTSEPESIRIYDEKLYFVDFYKRVIAYLPLSDLKSI